MRVPVYDSPQVQAAPLPGVRSNVSTDNGSEAIGEGLQRLGSGLDIEYQRAKEKADTVAVTNVVSDFQGVADDKLINHDTGILNQRGQKAFAAADGYLDQLKQAQQKVLDGLANDDQRRMAQQHTDQIIKHAHERVEYHLAEQQQTARVDAVNNVSDSGHTTVANAPDMPIATAIEQRARVEATLHQLGASPDAVADHLRVWDQRTAQIIVAPFISKTDPTTADADRAQQLLDAPYAPGSDGKMQTLGQVLGPARQQVQAAIDILKGKAGGDQLALDQVNAARRPNGSIDEAKLVQLAEVLPKAQRTPAFEQSLSKYTALERAAWVDKTSQNFNAALTAFQRNHSLADVPPSTEAWLRQNDPIGWGHLEETAANWGHKAEKTNPDLTGNYIALRADMADNPYKYRAMSPAQFNTLVAPHVSQSDFKELGDKFAEIRSKPEFELSLTGDSEQTVNGAFRDAFNIDPKLVSPTKWAPEQQAMWRTVHDYVEQKATDWTVKNKKKPDLEQLAKWADEKLHKVHLTGSGFSVLGHTFLGTDEPQVQAEAQGKAFDGGTTAPTAAAEPAVQTSAPTGPSAQDDENAVGVPALARAVILQAFQKQGRQPPSEEQLLAVYQRAKSAGRFK